MRDDEIRDIVRAALAEALDAAIMTLRNEPLIPFDAEPAEVEHRVTDDEILRTLKAYHGDGFIDPLARGSKPAKSCKIKKQRLAMLCEQWAAAGILNRERHGYRFPQPWEAVGIDGETKRAQVVRNAFDRKPCTLADIVPLFVDGTPQRVQTEVLDWLLREGLAIEFEKDRYMMEKP